MIHHDLWIICCVFRIELTEQNKNQLNDKAQRHETDVSTTSAELAQVFCIVFDFEISDLVNTQFANEIQILQIITDGQENEEEWENYQNHFAQMPNLKGIHFEYPSSSEFSESPIWQSRIDFFISSNIRIISENEFEAKEVQVSQNLPWRFMFGSYTIFTSQ